MNHRKHKQQQNSRKPRKPIYNPYENDLPDSKCPYCGQSGRGCSYINSLSRAWIRSACASKHKHIKIDEHS